MRVLHTPISPRFLSALAEQLEALDLGAELVPLGEVPGRVLVVPDRITPEELASAQEAGVEWIQAVTAGVEHVLIPELVASGIVVTSSGGTSARPMAEFVLARILEHAKRLDLIARQQAGATWASVWAADVRGATLTVVGLGPIGREVAAFARALDLHVVGVRRRPEAGPGPCDEVVGPGGLVQVLARSDYVVLAPALTPETTGLVGAGELAAMKDGALLVNVGRGDLVDEAALVDAVRDGRITAALDVVTEEPLRADSELWRCEAVRISPHCSSLTPSLLGELAAMIAGNVARFAVGEPLRNVVDKECGYPLVRRSAAEQPSS